MVKVEHLTKIYTSKKKAECVALDDVSFTLQSKGFVFIVGKSGSGKSTLLNLIGGLDKATSGNIVVDNFDFSSGDKFDEFRNSYMGFIFQDYHLIESMNVFENVRFALALQNREDDELVRETLKKVGLEGFENRFPKELSGGQQQRVAIARALVKNPSLILADEPTGNLDSSTTIQILNLLKEISKTSLVVIVSHSAINALEYADRVIELVDGKIAKDVSRDGEDNIKFSKDTITFPKGKTFSEQELEKINKRIKKGNYSLKQDDDIFKPTKKVDMTIQNVELKEDKLSKKTIYKTSGKFIKNNIFSLIFTTLIVSVLLVVFMLCQMLISFNGNNLFADEKFHRDELVLQKGYLGEFNFGKLATDCLVEISEEEQNEFKQKGYDFYKLINLNLQADRLWTLDSEISVGYDNYSKFYTPAGRGALICDDAYLNKIFGYGGEFELAAEREEKISCGIYITDYFADCITIYKNQPGDPERYFPDYESIVNALVIDDSYIVNGIIKTDYKERFKTLIDKFVAAQEDGIIDKNERVDIYASDEYLEFVDYANTYLAVGYTTNENFLADLKAYQLENFVGYAKFGTANIYYNDLLCTDGEIGITIRPNADLEGNDVYIDSRIYDIAFGEGAHENFEEKTIKISNIERKNVVKREVKKEITVTIKDVFENSSSYNLYCSKELYADLFGQNIYTYALLFHDIEDTNGLINMTNDLNYELTDSNYRSLNIVSNALTMYKNIFVLIAIILCVACLILLVSFGSRIVRKRVFEIGVMRALGTRQRDIIHMFVLQMVLAGLIICVVSTIGQIVVATMADAILSDALVYFTKIKEMAALKILNANPLMIVFSLGIAVVITILAIIVPLIKINRIKPIEIIKARD